MPKHTTNVAVSKTCVGAGLCIALAPNHFEFHRGRAQRTEHPIVNADDMSSIREAADLCPASAITVPGSDS